MSTQSHFPWLADLGRDAHFALRSLVRTPAFSIVAVFCLALGIGANAALFSVLNAVLLRPLPFPEPDRLVHVYEKIGDKGIGAVSLPNLRDWQAQSTGFEQLATWQNRNLNLQGSAEPERIRAVMATPNLFSLLRVPPLLGRTFAAGTDEPGVDRVAVLSENLWRTRFGTDHGLIGRTVRLDGLPYTVIGVMPNSFDFPAGGRATDIWVLYEPSARLANARGEHLFAVIGRLKDLMSLEEATAQLETVAARIEKEYPDEQTGRSVRIRPLHEDLVGDVRPALLILFGAVAMVLLIACANLANLLLARAAGRQREVAVRLALGATRIRLVRQLLVESLVLALAGAALGLLFMQWGLAALTPLAASALPIFQEFPLDGRVLAFLLGISLLSGLVFGIMPALQASRTDLRETLAEGVGKSTGSRHQRLFRSSLVVFEIAFSLILLIGAGLLLRGYIELSRTDPGLVPDHVLTAHLPVPDAQLEGATSHLFRPLLQEIRQLPGVRSAAQISMLPIQRAWMNGSFTIEGRPAPPLGQEPIAELRAASPGFFTTMGIPLLRGRDFTETDGEHAADVVIINSVLARRHFSGEDPLGRRLLFDGWTLTIVGVAGDVRQAGLDHAPLSEIYFPYNVPDLQAFLADSALVVRTAGDPAAAASGLRTAVRRIAPGLPLYDVLTMEEVISQSLAHRRLNLWLLGLFAGMALVLAATGLYGVISYLVAQRTREIGVRMALGAQTWNVIALVVRQAAGLAGVGIAVGLTGALTFASVLESLLYGVSARDPLTYAALAALLGLVALLATWLPAWRASRVDPLLAIRSE